MQFIGYKAILRTLIILTATHSKRILNMEKRHILVTSALPYANGPIHMGHLLEHIQTDIWVRFQRMCGHDCYYVCADDTHGTAMMLKADEMGISPETLIARVNTEHQKDLADFLVSHDNYYSTHSEENRQLAESIFKKLFDAGQIAVKSVSQLYDPEKSMFLADRFIVGGCPRCKAEDQYGDSCDKCGATYDATDLIAPRSKLSGATPVLKESKHYFFSLSNHTDFLKAWTTSGALQPQVANKLAEWLDAGLQDWDISRDAPYFGFLIPGETDKYFYVWLDAPIGYMASFRNYAEKNNLSFDQYWDSDSSYEMHHFIGKDIVNFHALFWPAMLKCTGYRTPTRVHVHGFITVQGEKMSKSKGTFITAREYLDQLDPQYMRYYYATKLSNSIDDMEINLDDFVQRVNSDLVGKVVNIASRCAGFISKQFDGRLSGATGNPLLKELQDAEGTLATLYEEDEFSKATRLILGLADKANQYIAEQQPWSLIKEEGKREQVHQVCSDGINLFRLIILYLKPVLPELAEKTEAFLNIAPLQWSDAQHLLHDHTINKFTPLLTRIESASVDAMIKPSEEPVETETSAPENTSEDQYIDISDFAKVDLRVARIIKAAPVEGADKLLQLTLDAGGETRNVFAGIKSAYEPTALEGRHVVLVANLKPRKMRFGVSEGMVLAAGPGGEDIFLLSPDAGAEPGMEVK